MLKVHNTEWKQENVCLMSWRMRLKGVFSYYKNISSGKPVYPYNHRTKKAEAGE